MSKELDFARNSRIVKLHTKCSDPEMIAEFVRRSDGTDFIGTAGFVISEMFEQFIPTYTPTELEDIIENLVLVENPRVTGKLSLRSVCPRNEEFLPYVPNPVSENAQGQALVHLADIIELANSISTEIGNSELEVRPETVGVLNSVFDQLDSLHSVTVGSEPQFTDLSDFEFATDGSDVINQDMVEYDPTTELDPFSNDIITYKPALKITKIGHGGRTFTPGTTGINEETTLTGVDEGRLKQLARMGLIDKSAVSPTMKAIADLNQGKTLPSARSRELTNSLLLSLIGLVTGDDTMFARARGSV